MKTNKLIRLAEKMLQSHRLNKIKLDMTWWAKNTNCGYTCCAGGFACEIWPRSLKLIESNSSIRTGKFDLFDNQERFGFDALEHFFDISLKQGDYIFAPSAYGDDVTVFDVARHIFEVVEGKIK